MARTIGIAGQLGNGKDVLADYLVKRLNERNKIGPWVRTAFANAVKQVFEDSFGVDRDFIEKWKRIPEPPPGLKMNVRKSLQFIGDGFRQIKDNIWIEIGLRGTDQKVISDSRYVNEAKAIDAAGGLMVVLWRPGFENNDPNPSESQILPIVQWCLDTNQDGPLHWSFDYELYPAPDGIQAYHYFMRNDGSIDQLHAKVDAELLPFLEAWWD
jgi:hypothetical protein